MPVPTVRVLSVLKPQSTVTAAKCRASGNTRSDATPVFGMGAGM